MFTGEDSDERIIEIEIEIRDVTFIEDVFPNRGDINNSFYLYEMEEE